MLVTRQLQSGTKKMNSSALCSLSPVQDLSQGWVSPTSINLIKIILHKTQAAQKPVSQMTVETSW